MRKLLETIIHRGICIIFGHIPSIDEVKARREEYVESMNVELALQFMIYDLLNHKFHCGFCGGKM